MTTAATPSQGWIIGYDLDGFLKQKDTSGTIIQIGVGGTAGISATPSLLDVLKVGSSTGTYSIEMGSNTSLITSGSNNQINFGTSALEISTNDGTYFGLNSIKQSLGEISISMTDLTSNTASTIDLNSISINNRVGDLTIYSVQNITPNSYYVTLNDTSLLSGQIDIIKSESTYDIGSLNKSSLHLNSYNSTTYGGIANSVIIGGSDMIAGENNTVYVPQLVIKDGDRIKSGAGYGLLEFNSANDVILATDKPFLSNSIIGIFSSTSSSTHLTGKNGILVRDTTTYSTTPAVQSPITSISSESAFIESGIYNSVIIGGVNLSATESNTVYLGNSVNINNAYKLPNVDGSLSEVLLTDGAGQAYWGTAPASTTPTLEQVLTQGNDSLGQNIVMGTGTSLVSGNGGGRIYLDEGFTSGNVVISTNNGSISDTYIDMNTSDLIIYSPSVFNLNFGNSTVISGNLEGLRYAFDYSATFVTYSLIDKNYVDSNFLSQVDNTSIELNGSNQVSLKSIIDGNRQFNDSVTILGDLAILGTTSTIYTENLVIEDNFITLNGTYSGPAIDAGIEVNLGDGTYSKIFWSSSYQYWNAGLSGSEQTIVSDAMNGLSQTDNKIGLGGVLSLNTIIYGQGYNLDIIDVGGMTLTASNFIDNKVYSVSTNTSQQFNDGDNYYTRVDDPSGTYSIVDITPGVLNIYNFDGVGYSGINFHSQDQPLSDGSTNNRIIVADDISQKGIVYRSDYTANFTTYSLVTKGYVDSISSTTPGNGLSYVSSGVIGLGGTLSQDTTVQVDNKNLHFLGASRISLTSSVYFSSRSQFLNSSTLLIHGPNTLRFLAHDISGGLLIYGAPGVTGSGLVGEMDTIKIESRVGTYSSIISTYAGSQAISDGSINNTLIVVDNINNKGIVYDGNYVGNFTTYSLVTKGYVDSQKVQGENGLTQSISGNIELGGTLTSQVFIEGDLKNFYINNLGRFSVTASVFIDNKVYNNLNESRIYNFGTAIDLKVTYDSSTYSRVFVDNQSTSIFAFDGSLSTGILITNIDQNINDGSSDNRLLVTDANQKGLVYTDDYTANFSTYSLVTKGYVDSAVSSGWTGTFSADGQIVTVTGGIITGVV